jgi:hypothetical protein
MTKRLGLILITLLITTSCEHPQPSEARMDPEKTIDMSLIDASDKTIDADLALKIAELILRSVHGDETYENQLPMKLTDGGDRWNIDGTVRRASSVYLDDPEGGYLSISIQKSNCRILKMVRYMTSG